MKRKLLVGLEDHEDTFVRAMSRYTGVTQGRLIRWAIRFYALQGPWTLEGKKARAKVIGDVCPLQVGPMITEGMQ